MKLDKTIKLSAVAMGLGMGAMMLPAMQSQATEGYFGNGWGARHSALGGAGVADGRDATILALNPAGLTNVDEESLQIALTLFSPRRGFTGSEQPSMTPNGEVRSTKNYFPVPNIAYSYKLDDVSAVGVSVYGNGGMNTNYPGISRLDAICGGGSGVFCGGEAGVDLMQAFIAVGYAREMGAFSIGISPLIVMQRFEAKGLGAFAGFSSDPTNLTNNGYDTSFGYGAKIGFQWNIMQGMRIGGVYQTRIYMDKFEKYAGLFAEQGDFDIPRNWQIGFASEVDADGKFTVMADWKKIYYSSIASVGGSPNVMTPFGASDGPGFGWKDILVSKIGMEYRYSNDWTWRLGYAFADNPVGTDEVTLNILAPGIVQHHITGGFSHKLSDKSTIEFAAAYVPSKTVLGNEQFNPYHRIELEMHQFSLTMSWTMKLGD